VGNSAPCSVPPSPLKSSGLNLRLGAHPIPPLSLGYGYGWFLGPGYRWIGGMTAGFRTAMWQYPAERLNVVMLWNNERIHSQHLFTTLRPILLG
jgi:CubicO group peptidase (beta-lactamase class C family)